MQRAFDWHTNTQFGLDVFEDKLQIVVKREANTRAQHPGLRALTGLERELDALVLYGPFSGTASQHYHVPNASGTDWIVNTAGNPQGVAYANDVISLIR